MPTWYYFNRPTQVAFHNLTLPTTKPPFYFRPLLGLGLKFIPTPHHSSTHKIVRQTFKKFTRDLHVKSFFAGSEIDPEREATFEMRYHLNSTWCPPTWDRDTVTTRRLKTFTQQYKALFRFHRNRSNLLSHQCSHLKWLQANRQRYIVANCDKNLGPALIETRVYVTRAIHDHLRHEHTYKRLTHREANAHKKTITTFIKSWTRRNSNVLTRQQRAYLRYHLRHNKTPWSYFYLTMKVHKEPWTTRPVVSYSGSLLYALSVIVERQLQQVAQLQPSYISNSKHLKGLLLSTPLPPNAILFTADANSMYTNIRTQAAMIIITKYLKEYQDDKELPPSTTVEALQFLMDFNIFRFGDSYFQQVEGAAMGAPPAPPYANLFFNKKEETLLPAFPEITFYKRYIDDVFGIWVPSTEQRWQAFIANINDFHGMTWKVSVLSTQVNFLDFTITIRDGVINTNLFEKT